MISNGDFFSGKYSADEVKRILEVNSRPTFMVKPFKAYYKKSATEYAPTWREKRELVHFLIHESTISPQAKQYLLDCEDWVPKYQLRGLKYGITTSALVYMFFPVVRRQPFLKRFTISMLPMIYFLRWGYVWGHDNYWRRVKEVTVTYEIFAGTRSKFTMK